MDWRCACTTRASTTSTVDGFEKEPSEQQREEDFHFPRDSADKQTQSMWAFVVRVRHLSMSMSGQPCSTPSAPFCTHEPWVVYVLDRASTAHHTSIYCACPGSSPRTLNICMQTRHHQPGCPAILHTCLSWLHNLRVRFVGDHRAWPATLPHHVSDPSATLLKRQEHGYPHYRS